MQDAFYVAMQSTFAPILGLCLFLILVLSSNVVRKHERNLFAITAVTLILCIITGVVEYIFAVPISEGGNTLVHYIASSANYAISPCLPCALTYISGTNTKILRKGLFVAPMIINLVLCTICAPIGAVFTINSANDMVSGPIYFLPYATAAFYLVTIVCLSMGENKPNKRNETLFLCAVIIAVLSASVIEVLLSIRFVVWTMAAFSIILYFLLLHVHMILFDALTGAYRRPACIRTLENIRKNRRCTITMIDVNGLKKVNDKYGHQEGDKAIISVVDAVKACKLKKSKLFRFGGDEFVLVVLDSSKNIVDHQLRFAEDRCVKIKDVNVSFAYGTIEFVGGDDIHKALKVIDQKMYDRKLKMKSLRT